MKNRTLLTYFVLILLCGTLLRLYHLGAEPLWMDEGYTLQTITWEVNETNSAKTVLARIVEKESSPPLYFMMLYYWTKLTNLSAYNLRLPSVLFSILSLFVIFLIGNKILNYRTGLIAMLLMAVSMSNIVFAQEARAYSLFVFLSLLSTYFFIRFVTEKKRWILYPIVTALMLYTHFFAFIVIGLQLLVYVLWNKHFKPKWYEVGESMIFPFFAWFFLFQFHKAQIARNIWWIKLIVAQQFGLVSIAHYIVPISIICFALGLGLLVFLQKKHKIADKLEFVFGAKFFLVFFTIYLILYMLSFAFIAKPVFYIRFPLFLFPIIYVYLAVMISRIKQHYILVGFLLIVSIGTTFIAYYKEDRKEQWDDVAGIITESEKEGDIILVIDKDLVFLFNQYYHGSLNTVSATSTSNMTSNYNMWNAVHFLTSGFGRLWFVNSHNYRSNNFWQDILNETYTFKHHTPLNGIGLYLYEIPGWNETMVNKSE